MAKKQRPRPAAESNWLRYRSLLLGLLVVVLGVIAYHRSVEGVFVFDDHRWIVDGQRIRSDLSDWQAFRVGGRPLLFYTLAVNYKLGGLNPQGYLLVNIAVHLATAVLLYDLVRRTLLLPRVRESFGPDSAWLAFAIAGIWVVHPLPTQAVNYVVQRCESMMSFFLLLVLYSFLRALDSARPWVWYLVALVAVTLGTHSKEVMIVAPLVVLAYDYALVSRSWRNIVTKHAVFYAVVAVPWLMLVDRARPHIRYNATAADAAPVAVTERPVAPEGAASTESSTTAAPPSIAPQRIGEFVTPVQYARTQAGVILHYLRLVVVPSPLCLDYYPWRVASWSEALLPGVIVIGLVIGSIVALLRLPGVGFLGIAFFLLLAPTSSIMPIQDLVFEHRMYLASAAVIALLVFGVYWFVGRSRFTSFSPSTRRLLLGGLLAAALIALSAGTIARSLDYHSREAIWSSVLAVRPNNTRAMTNLAEAYTESGRIDEARTLLDQAVLVDPRNPWVLGVRARLLFLEGRHVESAELSQRALEITTSDAVLHLNYGAALTKLQEWSGAEKHFREAIRLRPGMATAHKNLGFALVNQGNVDEGLAAYREALRLSPDDFETHLDFGAALATHGQIGSALVHFRRAAELRPDALIAHDNLAQAYADNGEFDKAIAAARQAIDLALRANQPEAVAQLQSRIRRYEQLRGASRRGG